MTSTTENGYMYVEKESWCCEDYSSLLLSKLNSSYSTGFLTDLTIQVEDKKFKVHKVIVACSSDYFAAMFTHNMVEATKNSINLKDLNLKGVEVLIEFIYTGKMRLCMDSLQDVLEVATFLQMPSAIKVCVDFLQYHLTFGNSKEYLALADIYGLEELHKFYRKFLLRHFLEFTETEEYLSLNSDKLIDLLGDDALRTTSETKLLRKVLIWYTHDKTNREAVIHSVLEQVRFTADGWPTYNLASEQEPFKSNPKCKKILEDMSAYMSMPEKRCLMQTPSTRVRYDNQTLVQFGGVTEIDLAVPEQGCAQNRYYHPEMKSWRRLGCISVLSEPRSHWKGVEIDGHMILCGGFIYNYLDDFRNTTNNVKTFEPSHLALWDMPKMHFDRAFHDVAYISGCVYAIGGQSDIAPLSSMECLDIMKGQWTLRMCLPHPRYNHAAAACNGKIYVTGGIEVSSVEVHTVVNQMNCYCPDEDQWCTLTPMFTARKAHTMTPHKDQLYVCGGIGKGGPGTCLPSVEAYNIELAQWTNLRRMASPVHDMAATALDGKILIVGGENPHSGYSDKIQQYNPDKNEWSMYGELWQPLKNMCCCAVKIRMTDDDEYDDDYYDDDVDSVHDFYSQQMEREIFEGGVRYEYQSGDSGSLDDDIA